VKLVLDKGALLFHIPKGAGGGTIKTASLTAAITGTAGKISDNYIVIVEGEVKLIPSGRIVHKNEFARRNADGSITIAPSIRRPSSRGLLVEFNGHMPGFPERALVAVGSTPVPFVGVRELEVLTPHAEFAGEREPLFPHSEAAGAEGAAGEKRPTPEEGPGHSASDSRYPVAR